MMWTHSRCTTDVKCFRTEKLRLNVMRDGVKLSVNIAPQSSGIAITAERRFGRNIDARAG